MKIATVQSSSLSCYLILLRPIQFSRPLFSNTLSLYTCLTVRDQVAHPYITTNKVIILYILICILVGNKVTGKVFCTEWEQAFPSFNLLLISSWMEFLSVRIVPKYLNFSAFSKDLLPISILLFFVHGVLQIWYYT
jgi:hypothetical protein